MVTDEEEAVPALRVLLAVGYGYTRVLARTVSRMGGEEQRRCIFGVGNRIVIS